MHFFEQFIFLAIASEIIRDIIYIRKLSEYGIILQYPFTRNIQNNLIQTVEIMSFKLS